MMMMMMIIIIIIITTTIMATYDAPNLSKYTTVVGAYNRNH